MKPWALPVTTGQKSQCRFPLGSLGERRQCWGCRDALRLLWVPELVVPTASSWAGGAEDDGAEVNNCFFPGKKQLPSVMGTE